MDNQSFLNTVATIFKKELIISYDEKLLQSFLQNNTKNTVVTKGLRSDRTAIFFKAIKPGKGPEVYGDYQRGLTVQKILDQAGVNSTAKILSAGSLDEVFYFVSSVLPFEHTITDARVHQLNFADARAIYEEYRNVQKRVSEIFKKDSELAGLLLSPTSRFGQVSAFCGQIALFNEMLGQKTASKNQSLIEKTTDLVRKLAPETPQDYYLVHGDLAPHNIILSDKVFFVDWERAYTSGHRLFVKDYDLANLFVYAYENPEFRKGLCAEEQSFNIAVVYHALYKAAYLVTFGQEKDPLFDACLKLLEETEI